MIREARPEFTEDQVEVQTLRPSAGQTTREARANGRLPQSRRSGKTDPQFVIMARTDAAGVGFDAAIARAKLYRDAGRT